ncbi:septation protein SepH [Nocardioides sp. NPDC057577]|uniref:septation protein SepH n=1 Tax=Nocardioides sp. NPDC057577 TaxID=3346171 RepID=UPI00366E401B
MSSSLRTAIRPPESAKTKHPTRSSTRRVSVCSTCKWSPRSSQKPQMPRPRRTATQYDAGLWRRVVTTVSRIEKRMSAEGLPLTPGQLEEQAPDEAGPVLLRLISVSDDGLRMLLVDDEDHEYTADIDDRLRAALEAVSTRRSEQTVNKTPSSSLRPRDIQTRIRSGESAEEVAAVAGTTVEKILAFAGPVLAEREHMAQRAQQASVRRRPGEAASTARTLGEAVSAHFQTMYVDPESVNWDSYRRPDGRWKLTGEYETPERSGIAELTYDAPGNFVEIDNDDARWLTGEKLEAPAPEPEPITDDMLAARRRRAQSSTPSTPAAQAPAASVPPVEAPAPVTPPPAPKPVKEPKPAKTAQVDVDTPLEAFLGAETPTDKQAPIPPEPEPTVIEPAAAEAPAEPEQADEAQPKPAKKSSARRKRASVPSWDEIMFGGGKSE